MSEISEIFQMYLFTVILDQRNHPCQLTLFIGKSIYLNILLIK